MIWAFLILVAILVLLVWNCEMLARLLVVLSLGWIALVFWSYHGDPSPAAAFGPPTALWLGMLGDRLIFAPPQPR